MVVAATVVARSAAARKELGADFRIFLGYGDPKSRFMEISPNTLAMVLVLACMLSDTLIAPSYSFLQH